MHYTGCYQIYLQIQPMKYMYLHMIHMYSTIEVFTCVLSMYFTIRVFTYYPCIQLSEYLHIIMYLTIGVFTYLFNYRSIDGCLPAPDRQKLLVASVAAFWTCVSDDRRSSTRGLPSATVRSVLPEERGNCMMMNISDLESS